MKQQRPRYHHGDLATALLVEAVAQVRERGVDQVSLRGLAYQVGVSASAAYQHFPDKAALLDAVCGWGFDELARRMRGAMATVTADGDDGAVSRFVAMGRAYVSFALTEPHLFRHMFGTQVKQEPPAADGAGFELQDDTAFALLLAGLAELAQRDLLRPGVGEGAALDILTWSLVHGFSALVVEQHLPVEAGEQVLRLYGRLVLRDEVWGLLGPVDVTVPT